VPGDLPILPISPRSPTQSSHAMQAAHRLQATHSKVAALKANPTPPNERTLAITPVL
jgi:hypothetical protein